MEALNNFTALIQLISAVNFANILFGYHKKVFRVLFNIKQTIDLKFDKVKKTTTIDLDSLQKIKPIDSTDGTSTEASIDTLKADYESFDIEFKTKLNTLYEDCRRASDTNWVKTFFLFISLYCVLDLLLIALIYTFNTTFTHCILHIINFATVIFIVIYVVNIFKQTSDPSYKVAIRDCAAIVIFAVLLSGLNSILISIGLDFPIPEWVEIISATLSILIPFIPCILCFFYVSLIVKKLHKQVDAKVEELSRKSDDLHKRVKVFNTVERLFQKKRIYTYSDTQEKV